MRRFAIYLAVAAAAILTSIPCSAVGDGLLPDTIRVEGGSFHVQGIAFDRDSGYLYLSFTSAFFKTDLNGNVVGSVSGINGHLGAMTFDADGRKIYASLELKDDAIGRNISDKLGEKAWTRDNSAFYIAEIDVDKIVRKDMSQVEAVELHLIEEAVRDYKATVEYDGRKLDHRFACSGIDGVTIAPAFGKDKSDKKYLYVAYGIYGDTERTDNDYNVLLCYPLDNIGKLRHKYFIHTGNTTWGIQNLAYDSYTGKMFLAVYKGKKAAFPNYDLFALDMSAEPERKRLEGVGYFRHRTEQIPLDKGWYYKWGSTGLCPIGDGLFYISENGKENGSQYCRATLCRWHDLNGIPFIHRQQ